MLTVKSRGGPEMTQKTKNKTKIKKSPNNTEEIVRLL